MKLAYYDFEFHGISEPKLNLVSVAILATDGGRVTYEREFWLHQERQAVQARRFFRTLFSQGYTFVAYVMEAEARSLLSLFHDDLWLQGFKAIDLYLEYRCLLNHNHELAYGLQYLDGRVIKTTPPPPKWEREESDLEAHHKPSFSLAAATYKLLGIEIDTVEKHAVRDVIIRGNADEIQASMARIQLYNKTDIIYLPKLLNAVFQQFKAKGFALDEWTSHALKRGDYAVRTARMIQAGYPIAEDKVGRFTANVDKILASAAKECLEVAPEVGAFRFDKRFQRYVMNEKGVRDWVKLQDRPYWRKTAGGKPSLSKDAFNDWFNSESEGFAGAFCRYLKTKQSLNGFMPSKGKAQFTDFIGKDGRARPYFGIYGSQSSRSQPGATGFIPLKAHWMRTFIEAKPGRALAGIDYASQEFLIAAIISQDRQMMAAYESGDVYLAFAKAAKLVPAHATKDTHKKSRDMAKALVLGISYDMSALGLAPRIAQATGEPCTEEVARALIDTFYETYPDYAAWKADTLIEYQETDRLMLPDGWTMWGDNTNRRSVGNFPIQGHGAVIMREAVRRAQDLGLTVIFTLHDALYIEFASQDVAAVSLLMLAMAQAFEAVMKPYGETRPIRLEGEAWSVDYAKELPSVSILNVKYLTSYVDDKGRRDLERYEPFFSTKPCQPSNEPVQHA